MRIIIDCYGGDYCPAEAVAGAVAALDKLPELTVILTGYEDELNALLQNYKYDKGRLEVAGATEVITNSDSPSKAVMRKKDSSTIVGIKLLSEGRADGMVSSANTGALLVGGSIILGISEGVTRAALCPVLPNAKGTYTIPAARIVADGKTLTSNSVKVVVSAADNSGGGARQGGGQPGMRAAGTRISGSDLFIKVSANKRRVHEQEPILLTYKVYTLVDLTQLKGNMPDLKGFHTQEVRMPQQKTG